VISTQTPVMNLETYVQNVISDLYDDPEGLITYGQILGLVTYDKSDISLGKSLDQRVEDSFHLIDFLTEQGDFVAAQYWCDDSNCPGYKALVGGNTELRALVDAALKSEGERHPSLLSDFNLMRTDRHESPRKPNEQIVQLFQFLSAGSHTLN
jgi:hypothetical protein